MADKKGHKMVEIRDRTDDELLDSLDRARDELFSSRMSSVTAKLKNVQVIGARRVEIARILTVMSERKRAAATRVAGAQNGTL